jgi:putative thioredoxin
MPRIFEIESAEEFDSRVLERSREVPVVVDFWAPWCGPCRVLAPVLEHLIEEGAGKYVLAKVDVDRVPELAERYRIAGIPAVKAFSDARLVDEFSGVLPEAALRSFLARLVPTPAELLARQARVLERDDAKTAEAMYRRALELEPNFPAAGLGLARILVASRRTDGEGEDPEAIARFLDNLLVPESDRAELDRLRAEFELRRSSHGQPTLDELQARFDHDPNNLDALHALGRALALAGDPGKGLGMLLRAAELDKQFARTKVKETMVEIFHWIGVRSPLADEYRTKLSRLIH